MVIDRYAERRKSSKHSREPNKVMRIAGILYGLSFGLSFALLVWGIDALMMHLNMADLAYAKLAIGLPLALLIGLIAGTIVNFVPSVILSALIWAAACGVLGYLAGHIPYEGVNTFAGLVDPRLAGLDLIPFTYSAEIRTLITVIISAFVGIAVGIVQSGTVQRVWDVTPPDGKLRLRALVPMLVCIPLALLPAIMAHSMVMRPFQIPHREVNRLITTAISSGAETAKAEGLNYRTVELFGENFTENYAIHFVSFYMATETLYSAYLDVNFDNGFVLRCATAGDRVTYCDNFSSKFAGWTGEIINYAQTGEKSWLEEEHKKLEVNQETLAWLSDHSQQITGNYHITRSGQQRGWILMTTDFDNGFSMQCRFHGLTPVSIDQCTETHLTTTP